jgi:uncharacterized protein YacL
MSPRPARAPGLVVELLRLCVVIFFASLGFQLAAVIDPGSDDVLGPFSAVSIGIILGSALGYVLGGVIGRTTISAVTRTERALDDTPAEEIVAGVFGTVIGVVVGAGVTWPVFLVDRPALTFPIFGFVVVSIGLLGYRLGARRRESIIGLFGARAGMAPPAAVVAAVPRVLDTSVAIDGRILDVVRSGFLHGRFLLPAPVIAELQGLADAGDDVRRGRGRRGLEVLEALRRERGVSVEVLHDDVVGVAEVDAKLVRICLDSGAALLTLDTNLARAASLAGIRVMNLHALALALRPPVTAGDEVSVLLIKPGKEAGQAVGYLDDGTMVVVETARDRVGGEAHVVVTSVLTTANGRMIFAKPTAAPVAASIT